MPWFPFKKFMLKRGIFICAFTGVLIASLKVSHYFLILNSAQACFLAVRKLIKALFLCGTPAWSMWHSAIRSEALQIRCFYPHQSSVSSQFTYTDTPVLDQLMEQLKRNHSRRKKKFLLTSVSLRRMQFWGWTGSRSNCQRRGMILTHERLEVND